jgi:CheY-like chemotaxis protein
MRAVTEADPAVPPFPLTILADADDAERRTLAASLTGCGWRVEEVDDGRVALARAISAGPDILLTAARLPGLNAAQLSRVLRADPQTSAIGIVVFGVDVERVPQFQIAGADSVLVQPVGADILIAETRRLLERSRSVRQQAAGTLRRAHDQVQRSSQLLAKALQHKHRVAMSKSLDRSQTTTPPLAPPSLSCPVCDRPLRYLYSHVGGVNERQREQWDYFECAGGCGTFQFRHRTNKVRRVNGAA